MRRRSSESDPSPATKARRIDSLFSARASAVAGNVTTAETDLMALVDNFQAALNADLTLAHTCDGIDIDTGLADAPDYRMFAGKEYREYPCIIIARQTGAFNPAP